MWSKRLSLAHDHRDAAGDGELRIQDIYIFLLYDNFFPVASVQKFVIFLRSTTLVCVCVCVCVCTCMPMHACICNFTPQKGFSTGLAWNTHWINDSWLEFPTSPKVGPQPCFLPL